MEQIKKKAIEFQKKQGYSTSDHMSKEACYRGFIEGAETFRELVLEALKNTQTIVDLNKFIRSVG